MLSCCTSRCVSCISCARAACSACRVGSAGTPPRSSQRCSSSTCSRGQGGAAHHPARVHLDRAHLLDRLPLPVALARLQGARLCTCAHEHALVHAQQPQQPRWRRRQHHPTPPIHLHCHAPLALRAAVSLADWQARRACCRSSVSSAVRSSWSAQRKGTAGSHRQAMRASCLLACSPPGPQGQRAPVVHPRPRRAARAAVHQDAGLRGWACCMHAAACALAGAARSGRAAVQLGALARARSPQPLRPRAPHTCRSAACAPPATARGWGRQQRAGRESPRGSPSYGVCVLVLQQPACQCAWLCLWCPSGKQQGAQWKGIGRPRGATAAPAQATKRALTTPPPPRASRHPLPPPPSGAGPPWPAPPSPA